MKSSEFLVCVCCCSAPSHTSMLIKLHLQRLQLERALKLNTNLFLNDVGGFLACVVLTILKHGDLKGVKTGVMFD